MRQFHGSECRSFSASCIGVVVVKGGEREGWRLADVRPVC